LLTICALGLQLDRGNLSNALTDKLLDDLNMDQNDYNNGTTVQLLCFLAAEFPVQLLIKRYGFKQVLPLLMMMWSLVSWTQAFMTDKTGFYITRALIGVCEGGFIPGTSKFARTSLRFQWTDDECSLVRNILLHLERAIRSPGGLLVNSQRRAYHFVVACCWHP
jgi:MFS family permease